MSCQEYFYSIRDAREFVEMLNYNGANSEIVETEDEDEGVTVYIVNYNPPRKLVYSRN